MTRAILVVVVALATASSAAAQYGQPKALSETSAFELQNVAFDQRLGERVPLDLAFRDDHDRAVTLRDYFGRKPVILVLAYFRCPRLCNEVLHGLVDCLAAIPFTPGKEFEVVVVSFDHREPVSLAAARKRGYLQKYGRPGTEDGWHFLVGREDAIVPLAEAVGFQYVYDRRFDQYAHASGIMLLTPEGRLARYFYGIRYPPRDVRLGLVEASEDKIGSPVEQLLLFCFQYDGVTGKYSLAIMNLVRLLSVTMALGIGACLFVAWRRSRRAPGEPAGVNSASVPGQRLID